ncbi:MAG: PCYCGC motif-containing (lipo)protein [Deltaproteobacteria bacterium]|nr:PCYCGC motif-containing (lipo)protein [Deltaproteobacteria bacterium]
MDSLYCYCDCKKHFGHKSLLTCYVDEHAVYCDICIDEALMARELHGQGMDVLAIRKAVDEKYSSLRHEH